MTVGTDSWKGLGVPLFGDFEIVQRTAATDMVTLTGATGQGGDFFVCRIAAGTEKFVVDVSGNITVAGTSALVGAVTASSTILSGGAISVPAGSGFGFTTLGTTAPTPTAAGQLFLLQASTAIQLGASNASNDMTYFALATTTAIS